MRTIAFCIMMFGVFACASAVDAGMRAKQAGKAGRIIAFYGDSTIRGYKAHSGAQVIKSTPQAFAEALAPNPPFVVRNEGADSSRVEHLLAGTDGRHAAWAKYLPSSGVDIVIINHASKNGNPVDRYKEDMRTAVMLARQNGKFVILMTPSPISEGGLEAYVDVMRQLAVEERVPLIDVFRYLKRYMARTGSSIDDLVPDGYHPAEDVYVLIGQYAAQEFQKIARQSRVK
ncbi:hypothetical protein GCM10027343_25590 [Noviherbaspirillum agri]